MSTPTPDSWIIATGNSWRRIVSEQTGMTVCEPITQPDGHPDLRFPNGGADGPDAHLIAAAPDTYEALKVVTDILNEIREGGEYSGSTSIEDWPELQAAYAALAKAEGKS